MALVDERPGMNAARDRGITVVTTPLIIAKLHADRVLSGEAALLKLALIRGSTHPPLIGAAEHAIHQAAAAHELADLELAELPEEDTWDME